jgi:tetratricopeptide (TPR) repeat protein
MKQQSDDLFDGLLNFYTKQAFWFYKRNMGKRDCLDLTAGLNMVTTCINMAELYWCRGNESEALKHFKNAVFIGKLVEPDSLVVARAFSNMGIIYRNQGKLDDALKCYQECVLTEEHLMPNSKTVAISYETIGAILTRQGKLKEASVAFSLARLMG